MDNTRARFPETKTIFGCSGGEEVINFFIDVDGAFKILDTTDLGLNQMVAVYGGGDCSGVHTSRHELEQGHLTYYVSGAKQ